MGKGKIEESVILDLWTKNMKSLSEKERRILAASLANAYGYGGITVCQNITGLSRVTITKGIKEIKLQENETGILLSDNIAHEILFLQNGNRARHPGGGRKREVDKHPEIYTIVKGLLDASAYGDPEGEILWFDATLGNIKDELLKHNFRISRPTISIIISDLGYTLQKNQKMLQVGHPHPDRNEQMEYIKTFIVECLENGIVVISVDTKAKITMGKFAVSGTEYRPSGQPRKVYDHDFVSFGSGVAIPFGVYVLNNNKGFVNLGCDHDTSKFSVESIRRWWKYQGCHDFPNAKKLAIICDGGGSNPWRGNLWKHELWLFAREAGFKEIHVSHYPTGASKFNKIEHRLFNQISRTWKAKTLDDLEKIKGYIETTKTSTGLTVKCMIDTGEYPTGTKLTAEEILEINITRKDILPNWNYIIMP